TGRGRPDRANSPTPSGWNFCMGSWGDGGRAEMRRGGLAGGRHDPACGATGAASVATPRLTVARRCSVRRARPLVAALLEPVHLEPAVARGAVLLVGLAGVTPSGAQAQRRRAGVKPPRPARTEAYHPAAVGQQVDVHLRLLDDLRLLDGEARPFDRVPSGR